LRLREHALGEMPQDVVERDEDRDLNEKRQARGRRIDLVLFVEAHDFLVHARAVLLVLLLDRLQLGRVSLEMLHRAELLDGERKGNDGHERSFETTSTTRPSSQGKPRLSSASPRPGRAMST